MTAVNRLWAVGATIVVIAVLLMGWFLGASPRFDEIRNNDIQREAAAAQNAIQAANLIELREQYERIDELRAQLEELQLAVPPRASLSTFIGQLNDLEAASGVSITNITAIDAAPFEAAEQESSVVPAPVEGETPVAGAPVAEAPAPPADALPSDEFVLIKVGLSVSGSQESIFNFIDALQKGTRLYLVTALVVSGNPEEGYTAEIEGNVYVLIDPSQPDDDEEEEIPELVEPEPSASPEPSSSPSPATP